MGCMGFPIMRPSPLRELSLSSYSMMISAPSPPFKKKKSLPKADKHCLVIGPQWITF